MSRNTELAVSRNTQIEECCRLKTKAVNFENVLVKEKAVRSVYPDLLSVSPKNSVFHEGSGAFEIQLVH
jgi:hypothetical protein